MPGPSSIGQNKTTHLLEVNHVYWQKAYWSWGRRWNGTYHSLTWGGLPGGGPSREGRRGESKGPCCCHHAQGTPHVLEPPLGRESPKVFGMAEGVASIPTSGGHWGYPPTNQDPEAESGIKPALPNDTNKTTSLPSEDLNSTSALPANSSLGALVWLPTPLHGFSGVTACLHAPELIEVDLKVPVGAMPIGLMVAAPGISSVSSSYIVKDEITGHNLHGHHHNLHWEGDH